MEYQQINGTDFYNFPHTDRESRFLFWMGEDYLLYLQETFLTMFKRGDPLTELLSIKCEEDPQYQYSVTPPDISTGKSLITAITVSFRLQFLLKGEGGVYWRLYGSSGFFGTELNTAHGKIAHNFKLEKTEKL